MPSPSSASTMPGFLIQNSWGNKFGAGGFRRRRPTSTGWPTPWTPGWSRSACPAWSQGAWQSAPPATQPPPQRPAPTRPSGGTAGSPTGTAWCSATTAACNAILTEDEPAAQAAATGLCAARPMVPRHATGQRAQAPGALRTWRAQQRGRRDQARRARMGRFFVGNGCYPIFLVWKTGLGESIRNILEDSRQKQPAVGGAGEWFTEKTDLLIEEDDRPPPGQAGVERDEGERRAGVRAPSWRRTAARTRFKRCRPRGARSSSCTWSGTRPAPSCLGICSKAARARSAVRTAVKSACISTRRPARWRLQASTMPPTPR